MATKKKIVAEGVKIMTPEFRASYPQLFEAKAAPGSTKLEYSIVALFRTVETKESKERGEKVVDIEPLKKLVRDVLTEVYGADRAEWPVKIELPFRSGEEPDLKDRDGYGAGVVWCRFKSKFRPGVVYPHAGPDGKPAVMDVPTDLYGGCYARATINAYHWEFMGKVGVSLGLQNVQKIRDGAPFGNRTSAAADFPSIDVPAGAPAGSAAGAAQGGAGSDIGV